MPVWPTNDGHFDAATLIIAPCKSALTTALLNCSYIGSCTSGIRCSSPSPIKYSCNCLRMYCIQISCSGTISAYLMDLVGNVYSPRSANCFRDNVLDGLLFLRTFLLDNCFLLFRPVRTVRCCRLMDTSSRFCGTTRSVTNSTSSSRFRSTTEMNAFYRIAIEEFVQ